MPEQYTDLAYTDEFGLGSWIGTAVHAYLEETLDITGAIKEQKNFIHHLEGYGDIRGSTDLFVPPHVVDYKCVGKWSYDKMRLAYKEHPNRIPTTSYRVQQMTYAYGWKQLGYEVETVSLCVIPKHSNDVDDVRFFTELYNEEVVTRSLARLEKIWRYVQEGRLSDLPSDGEDCYTCSRVLFRA